MVPESNQVRATDPTPSGDAEPARAVQPWSDAGRAIGARRRERRVARRTGMLRLQEQLADIVVRDAQEEASMLSVVNLALRVVWKPVLIAAAVLLRDALGITDYTVPELAVGILLAVMIGLAIDPVWRMIRGIDAPSDHGRHDPFSVETTERDFVRLNVAADRDDEVSSA